VRAVGGRLERVQHLPPKTCRWQGPARLTKRNCFALSNARNTGLVVARGERVVLVDDCCVVSDTWLARHIMWNGHGVAGSYHTHLTASVVNGRVVAHDDGPYGLDSRCEMMPHPARTNGGWGYGLNTSFLLETAIKANGFDERYDGAGGSEDADAGVRFERAGLPYIWDPHCRVFPILGTHDPVFDHVAWDGRAGQDITKRAPKELTLKTGRVAFANEKLIEMLVEDPARYLPLGNAFDLSDLRQKWVQTGRIEHDFESDVDWRDGQSLSEIA